MQRDWRDDRIAELEAELAAKGVVIAAQAARISEQDGRIGELEKRLAQLGEQLGRQEDSLMSLLWRAIGAALDVRVPFA